LDLWNEFCSLGKVLDSLLNIVAFDLKFANPRIKEKLILMLIESFTFDNYYYFGSFFE
jgi:hypothetical protein